MLIPHLHDWPTTEADALALQLKLASRVDVSVPLGPIRTLAGCDLAYDIASSSSTGRVGL